MNTSVIDQLLNKVIGWVDQGFAWFGSMFFSDSKRMDLLFVLVIGFFATKIFKVKLGGGK
jgi:hypothetical protein